MITTRNIMKLEPRQKIFNYIQKYPGMHLRDISRQTNIPKTTLVHHLKYLKKQFNQNGHRNLFFLSDKQRHNPECHLLKPDAAES